MNMSAPNTGNGAATVTAGAGTGDITSSPKNVRDFMSRVVAWPVNGIGHVNLHYSMANPRGGKDIVTGKPYQDIDQLLSFCGWAGNTNNIKELWYCTSLQSQTGTNSKGGLKAVRLKQNALYLKAIWVDIDVKPDDTTGKHYRTVEEAWAAAAKFRADAGLPQFSAVVASGAGLHVYWISKTPMTPDVWRPYAEGFKALLLQHGIKCDAGLTTDDVRLLRVPGTLNHKYSPPRRVELRALLESDYDFDTALAFLTTIAPGPSPGSSASGQKQLFDADAFASAKPIIAAPDKLSDGIEPRGDFLLDPGPIFKGCKFLSDALKTGGKDYANPLWHLSILASTFMEDGNVIAHKISKGHPSYTEAETQTQYDRKVAERKARGIGYPSCATIQDNGCLACAACPLLSKGKSPLNLGLPSARASLSHTQVAIAGVGFRDLDKFGQPKPTLANAVIAIRSLGIEARLDLFHNRTTVSHDGTIKTIREGLLADQTVSAVRSLINNTYQIDCGDPNTFAAINEIARDNAFDPVLDLLDDCQGKWDGVKRLDTWVVGYLGCEDTPLNRAIGRSVLTAACRRPRVPGCKFDFITVLEGPEGIDKSTAIRVLAGDENFNDQSILGASDKEIQEQLEGTWMHENADLAGMRRADVEQVSRQVDRARPAYGRVREDRPRRSIEWATTNDDTYLLSQTGNRRWWTLKTGKVDIEALKRDREQLLGEAATYEAAGESIGLEESLWGDARNAQEQRRVTDPWEDALAKLDGNLGIVHRLGDGFERVFSTDLLTHVLDIPKAQQTSQHSQRLAQVMKHAGWGRGETGRITIGGVTLRGYIRAVPFSVAQRLVHSAMGITDPPPLPVRTGICDQPLTG